MRPCFPGYTETETDDARLYESVSSNSPREFERREFEFKLSFITHKVGTRDARLSSLARVESATALASDDSPWEPGTRFPRPRLDLATEGTEVARRGAGAKGDPCRTLGRSAADRGRPWAVPRSSVP